MADKDTDVEQTLHVARSISVYRIPPRPGSNGWRSGEWLVSDKLFSGRLRIVAKGELCEVRLEEPQSGELFAVCPVHHGQRSVCVEPVTDSSRYYVLRVEDAATRRHAFLGMGFDNRNDAFDFNEALIRHEQHIARARAANAKVAAAVSASSSSSSATTAAASAPSADTAAGGAETSTSCSSTSAWPEPQYWGSGTADAMGTAVAEIEGLYRHTAGLRLQEGQTIRVNVAGLRKGGAAAGPSAGGSFLSGLSSPQVTTTRLSGKAGGPLPALGSIPPPLAPPIQAPASSLSSSSQQGGTLQSQTLSAPPRDQVLNASWKDGSVMPLTNGDPNWNGFVHGLGGKSFGGFVTHTTGIVATSGQENWATFE